MAIKFTTQQQKVIDARNANILVSAAAGSGKTAVLTERILKMVCDERNPVDIDRLLVVTFTNAAAAEMRERIRAGLSDRMSGNPDSVHIQRQTILIHNAMITTIDSFSLYILRNHFQEIGIDPAFRVGDEGEIRLLEQDTLSELLEERFAQKSEDFQNCVEFFCPGGKESILEKLILSLDHYADSFPWPKDWLMKRKEDYADNEITDVLKTEYGGYLLRYLQGILGGCVQKLEGALRLCGEPGGPYMFGNLLEEEKEKLQGICHRFFDGGEAGAGNMAELSEAVTGFSFARLPSKKDDSVRADQRELVKKMRDDVKNTMKDLGGKFFATPSALALSQEKACEPYVAELIDLVLQFDERLAERKRKKKIVSFSDIEHFCLDILLRKDPDTGTVYPSEVAKEYRQYFAEVLIDEYQDSNLVQEYILKAVSGEEDGHYNRFMVGDVKQSIYKFRLARPELFLEKYETYETKKDCLRIDLSQNFRSRREVIETVNGVFGTIMDRSTVGLDYDEKAALYAGAVYPEKEGAESELILVNRSEETESKVIEARCIAQRIRRLRESFRVTDRDSGALRPVRYSDIVILLRTNAGWDEEFKKVLDDEGIPAYITSKTGYFSATEIQKLLLFLRVLDNPYQDIPLFGCMKSIFGGFTDEEAALIRGEQNTCFLYENLCRAACRKGTSVAEKCRAFLDKIEKFRELTAYLTIRKLLQRIVDEYGYLDYVTAMPGGGKRRANVEMLFQKAADFEKTSYYGLFHFVRYIEQLEKYDVDFGGADKLDENSDVVRIMSIHKSKGLEFPVTFVAGLSKRFNMQDTNGSVVVDMDLGMGCDYFDLHRRIKNKTLRKMVIAAKMREDNLAEEMRVLYVALTRAKEKLIMTAVVDNGEETLEKQENAGMRKLSYGDFLQAQNALDFILPAVKKKEAGIRVFVENEEQFAAESATEQVHLKERMEKLENADDLCDTIKRKELKERFESRYPYEGMSKLYTKTTVSELKIAAMADKDEAAWHSFEEKEIVPYIPSFAESKEKVSGTVRGNAYHRAMELLDFEQVFDVFENDAEKTLALADYETFRKQMEQSGKKEVLSRKLHDFLCEEKASLRLSEEYFAALQEKKILSFLTSTIGFRMWRAQKAGTLYREQPFVLGIEAERLIDNIPAGEKVLIQGIIDVYFEENGKIILLDYKTDVIKNMEDLRNRYQTQLDYYEEALCKLTGIPVEEKLLYSFHLGEWG